MLANHDCAAIERSDWRRGSLDPDLPPDHTQLIAECDREQELALFEKPLPEARYPGEIGLDAGPRVYKSFEAQERAFVQIVRTCAEQGTKVLTIHGVLTGAKVLQHSEKSFPIDGDQVDPHW